jgi:Protein of unknown function (DUF2845)
MRHLLPLLFLLPLQAAAHDSDTRSFRCKQDLVSLGDSRSTVLQRCGEPAMRDSFCAAQPPIRLPDGRQRGAPCEPVDEWTYNPGWGQFWTTLRFVDGKLVAIRYGDRVK